MALSLRSRITSKFLLRSAKRSFANISGQSTQQCSSMTRKQIIKANGHSVDKFNGDTSPAAIVKVRKCKLRSSSILASKFLREGKVVALPTDTIYGIAALVQDQQAVQQIYKIKGRDLSKPIAICVAEIDDVYRWGEVTVPRELLESLLPGPVTLCFNRSVELNPEFNPGASLVGIRIPDHFFVRDVCRQVDKVPLALTSANVSSSTSTLEITEFESLYPMLSAIFDGGKLGDTPEARLGSTVVDLSLNGHFKIIRPGCAKENTVKVLEHYNLKESEN